MNLEILEANLNNSKHAKADGSQSLHLQRDALRAEGIDDGDSPA